MGKGGRRYRGVWLQPALNIRWEEMLQPALNIRWEEMLQPALNRVFALNIRWEEIGVFGSNQTSTSAGRR